MINKETVKNKIRQILVEEILLPYKIDEIKTDQNLIKQFGIDSIQLMELIVYLEDEYKVSFEEENLDINVLNSVDSIADFVVNRQK